MDGFPVHYGEAVVGLSREFTMRVLWFHHTGDNVAHYQLGGFRSRGKAGCRRCLVYAEQMAPRSSEYVYNNNRRELRFPPAKRIAEDTFKLLKGAESAPTETEKEQKLLDSGLSKATSVWKLFQLYGFDPSNDFVFDVLRTLALNVIKKWPKLNNHRGLKTEFFKAADYTSFVRWVLPSALHEWQAQVENEILDLGFLCMQIVEIFYQHFQQGWTEDLMEITKTLLQSWRIQSKEFYGKNSAILEHVAGCGELLDDVKRHGPHWLYWCYRYEGFVKQYKAILTNHRSIEVSLAYFQYKRMNTIVQVQRQIDEDNKTPEERGAIAVHECLKLPSHHGSQTCDLQQCCLVDVVSWVLWLEHAAQFYALCYGWNMLHGSAL